jgi:hypothetical protein
MTGRCSRFPRAPFPPFFSLPSACPVVSTHAAESSCIHQQFPTPVPANDLLVSSYRAGGRGMEGISSASLVGSPDISAICCPLNRPPCGFTSLALLPSSFSSVPANDRGKA